VTDVRHITHDPDLAALRAQLTRVEALLENIKEGVDALVCQAPMERTLWEEDDGA
jgi:hypothetical protein